MESARVTTTVAVYIMIGIGAVSAETLSTHRIPALLAAKAVKMKQCPCERWRAGGYRQCEKIRCV